ncbi:MAG TPA: DoxX family protein [Casimicrobiaceae bacterium]|jgi:putative oxidoreductase
MDTATQAARPALANHPAADYPARDAAVLIGRILLAVLFITSGWGKLMAFQGAVGAIGSKGLPLPEVLAALTVLIELGGGIALAIGWKARWAALLIALFIVIITPLFHNYWAVPAAQVAAQKINFFKNLSILGGMLAIYAFGPGRYSIENKNLRGKAG